MQEVLTRYAGPLYNIVSSNPQTGEGFAVCEFSDTICLWKSGPSERDYFTSTNGNRTVTVFFVCTTKVSAFDGTVFSEPAGSAKENLFKEIF